MQLFDRKALALLLSTLLFLLSACGTPNGSTSSAQPTGVAATAAGTPAATTTTTPTVSSATPTATGTGGATATPTSVASPAAGTPTMITLTPTIVDDTDPFTGTTDITDTDDVTVTVELTPTGVLTVTHPVAIAIANAFAVPIIEVIMLHEQGLGFGEIARAYFLARELAADTDASNNLTVVQILALHQSGQGWGQIVVALGLPQGNSQRNLGLIMRVYQPAHATVVIAPVVVEQGSGHGPPAIPPGQLKKQGQGHGNGNANGHGKSGGNGKGKKGK